MYINQIVKEYFDIGIENRNQPKIKRKKNPAVERDSNSYLPFLRMISGSGLGSVIDPSVPVVETVPVVGVITPLPVGATTPPPVVPDVGEAVRLGAAFHDGTSDVDLVGATVSF